MGSVEMKMIIKKIETKKAKWSQAYIRDSFCYHYAQLNVNDSDWLNWKTSATDGW